MAGKTTATEETKTSENIEDVTETIQKDTSKTKKDTVYIVETPVENFCGIGAAGIQFAYGRAEVHEGWVLDWFREHGYKVSEKK